MIAPDCRFCGRRCFVLRTMPADSLHYAGKELLLATCPGGMNHDRRSTGHDHQSAVDALAPWPPAGMPAAAPAAVPGDLPHIDQPQPALPLAQLCEVCDVPVAGDYIAKTGRALHGPCAARAGSAA